MKNFKLIYTLCIIWLLPYNAFAYDCDKLLAEFEKCDASPKFISIYKQICRKGEQLSPSSLEHFYEVLEVELITNRCLSDIYEEPVPEIYLHNDKADAVAEEEVED